MDNKLKTCPACGAELIYLRNTESGKITPCDADKVSPEDCEFDRTKHRTHFHSCGDVDRFVSERERPSRPCQG